MGASTNDIDAFERQVKESLAQYEVPYNSADWAQMERALSSGVRGWGHGRAIVVGLLLAGGLLIGGTAFYLGRDAGTEVAASNATVPSPSVPSEAVPASITAPASSTPMAEVPASHHTSKAAAPSTPSGPGHSGQATTAHKNAAAPRTAATPSLASVTPVSNAPANVPANGDAPTMFRSSVKNACPDTPVDFTVEHMPEDGIYLWNFGDGSFSNRPNPQHTFTKPGSYQVMLSMSNTGMGTIHNKPSSDMIVIHDAPTAAFNVLKQDYAGQLPSVHFENRSLGSVSYQWDLGDGTMSTLANPDHVYKIKGVYKVELTVANETGCVDRKMKEVRIDKDFNLGAAASFSPDGDGKDETFMPESLLSLTNKFQLAIYDPSGQMVYSTSDATHPWCGKVKNQGAVCETGEYVWVVDVENGARPTETFTGKVKLLR